MGLVVFVKLYYLLIIYISSVPRGPEGRPGHRGGPRGAPGHAPAAGRLRVGDLHMN